MNRIQKALFLVCLLLSFATMIQGHVAILKAGAWFIPGQEKYNIFTRWVSDFAAVWPQGLWIKGSIVLFCIALLILKRARLESSGGGAFGHLYWGWNVILAFALIGGLLLVALYDMSPPQFTLKEPSWLAKLLGEHPKPVLVPNNPDDYLKQWHHRLGFQLFIISFALTLATAAVEKKVRPDVCGFRRDVFFLMTTFVFMLWLFCFHKSLPGIPQRALLMTIFLWVGKEGMQQNRPVS